MQSEINIHVKKRRKPLILLTNIGFSLGAYLVTLLIVTQARAESLTLEKALQEALGDSPVVQRSKFNTSEQYWKKVEAGSAYLPTLSGTVNYLTNKEYALLDVNLGGGTVAIPQVVPTTQYTLSARWNVFDGFATTTRYLSADENESSAKLEQQWVIFQTERQVLLNYYKLIAAVQVKTVSEQNLKALKDHAKDVEALKKAGVSTQYDLLRTQVQVSESEAEFINATDQVEIARNKLAEVLGHENETREIVGSLPIFPDSMVSNIVSKLNLKVDQKIDLLALQKKLQASQYNASSLNKHWFPKVSLFADYGLYNNRNDHFSDDKAFRETYLIGAALTWNIFDGFGAVAKEHQAEAQSLQLARTVKISETKAKNDLDFWKRKFNYFTLLSKTKLTDIDRSNEAVRLAKVGRKAGVRTNTELLEAQADVYRSKAALINAQYGAIESLVNIELATGTQLYNFSNNN